MPTCLIVFSHLRWDFVFQRPQHLLSRLARDARVYFFEEPVYAEGAPFLEVRQPTPNVRVVRPHTPVRQPGFHDEQLPILQRLLAELVEAEGLDDYAVWFYTPMALPLADRLSPSAVVYDCMDELAAFLHAPRQLLQRESALMKAADVVFTGGPSLYRAKKDRHRNVHCLPSSVDGAHFAQALAPGFDHPAQAALPHPRLGFYGVIDERVDLDLIGRLADARPDWQLVMVGPVVKIDPATLPRRPNVHYLGQRTYQELPALIAGWDLCLLPFALNDSTRFISPTKTLEYMAAEKPIVGTPITDVVDAHGDIVHIADTAEEFVAHCERALAADASARAARARAMRERVATTSWDATAERMRELIGRAAHARRRTFAPLAASAEDTATLNRVAIPVKAKRPTRVEHEAVGSGARASGGTSLDAVASTAGGASSA